MDSFSTTEFMATDVGRATTLAIERHAGEIISTADLGLAPLTILIPDLEALVGERLQWKMVDSMIRDWLAPSFEATERVRVPTDLPHKALCYRRITKT